MDAPNAQDIALKCKNLEWGTEPVTSATPAAATKQLSGASGGGGGDGFGIDGTSPNSGRNERSRKKP